jgi:high-affinity iron transporter
LEAALITAIIIAYLKRTERDSLSQYVWYGVYLAIIASFIFGLSIWFLYGFISGPTKALFEGIASLVAVLVLSTMIYWMAGKGKEIKSEVEKRMKSITSKEASLALISFSFIVVFREGLETVLFLTPFLVEDSIGTIIGAFIGLVVSTAFAYMIFILGKRINIKRFFYFTSILLVLLAGGLAGYGVHELIEYTKDIGGETGWLGNYAYILDIPSDSPFHHKGVIGSIFAVMFGYTVKAEWARVIVHLIFLTVSLPLVVYIYKTKRT